MIGDAIRSRLDVCPPSKQSKQRGQNGPSGYDFEGGVRLGAGKCRGKFK